MRTKLLSTILAVTLAAFSLASCSGDKAEPEGITPSKKTDVSMEDGHSFSAGSYNDEDFTFLVIKHTDSIKDYYGGDYIDADTYTGAVVNDAVHERNLAVEEKYNVNIEQLTQVSGDPASVLQTYYMSGDFCFDVIYGWGYKLGSCITENYFADIASLPGVDLTQEYWSPSAMKDLSINGKLYITINDISMNKLEWAELLFYNKTMAENYNLEETFGSPVEMVKNGTWTLDTYLAMLQSVSTDLDGDGEITGSDVFGLVDGNTSGLSLVHASGIYYTSKNADGSYSLNFYSDKLLSLAEKVQKIYANSEYVKSYDELWSTGDFSDYSDRWEYARSFFSTGHSLFCAGSAYITDEFRNMTDEYGILPLPKYDENQTEYYSNVSSPASLFAVPVTSRNDVSCAGAERTGAILEYMSYKSNKILLPAYYEKLLKEQRLGDTDDRKMLDIIRDTVHYEFTDMVGLPVSSVVNSIMQRPSAATSTYIRNQNKMIKAIDDFYRDVLSLDDRETVSSE